MCPWEGMQSCRDVHEGLLKGAILICFFSPQKRNVDISASWLVQVQLVMKQTRNQRLPDIAFTGFSSLVKISFFFPSEQVFRNSLSINHLFSHYFLMS